MAQLVARSTPDQCVVGSSPTCGTEHFGFPPSAPRLGNKRPWYVQPRLCDWAYKRSRATYRKEKGIVVVGFLLVSLSLPPIGEGILKSSGLGFPIIPVVVVVVVVNHGVYLAHYSRYLDETW